MKTFTILSVFLIAAFATFGQCPPPTCPDYWNIKGNIGTSTQLNNFIGTIDNEGLAFRTNNIDRAKISDGGLFFINRNATASVPISSATMNADIGVNYITSAWTGGTLNLAAYKEKGRLFHIINYSGATLVLSDVVRISSTAVVSTIPNNGRWYIQWTGTAFILLSAN